MTFKRILLTATATSLLTLGYAQANINAMDKDTIGKAAVEYLKTHPEAFADIINSVQEHAKKEHEKAQEAKLAKYGSALFDTKNGTPYIGNATGTTEVVVFMDPFCSYCRKFETVLKEAIKTNKNLKIIARDIAIMHEKSLMLVKATVAASNQGKYAEMQTAVHGVDPSVTESDVFTMAKSLNLDMVAFKKDMASKKTEALIKNNMDIADGLDVNGTPSFIVKGSKKIISGFMPLEAFQQALKG